MSILLTDDGFKISVLGTDFGIEALEGANLIATKNLSLDELLKVETLYNAKVDEELIIPLKEKYPSLFEEPNH